MSNTHGLSTRAQVKVVAVALLLSLGPACGGSAGADASAATDPEVERAIDGMRERIGGLGYGHLTDAEIEAAANSMCALLDDGVSPKTISDVAILITMPVLKEHLPDEEVTTSYVFLGDDILFVAVSGACRDHYEMIDDLMSSAGL